MVDLKWGTQKMTVTTGKTGKEVTVPIHPQFASWLQRQPYGIGKAPVFATLVGKNSAGETDSQCSSSALWNALAFEVAH